jgi:hypothetical protein
MSSWAKNRRLLYGGVFLLIVLGIAAYIVFSFFYKAPTCFDGLKNSDEQGIDCGGSCQRLCQSAFLAPSVSWVGFDQLVPGAYNAAAYIVNPNTDGEALNVPFHIILFDDQGIQITDTTGFVHIPPHRNTLAFVGPISVGKRTPYKAFFEFTAAPDWHKKADTLSALSIENKKYSEDESGSSLIVTLKNTAVKPIGKMSVYAALYDANSAPIGDSIGGELTADAPFTWPTNRQGHVISIEVLPVAE